ncbi:uncharacterized protein [Spinacia oleracea]|uniref:Uncharacterized protein isoform X2 n=1 Tax=Spinacia oleracea TaxID=3562 RepID=A0ABM3RGH2_SPIOL|nr:uncharacterized protein LOC130469431 isoform X2 [Spinacia oleracea]
MAKRNLDAKDLKENGEKRMRTIDSEGGSFKQKFERKEAKEGHTAVPNVRCCPEKILALTICLSEVQQQWVKEFGFEYLMHMDNFQVNRKLAYWLVSRFDPDKCKLKLRDDVSVDIFADDISWILGIPNDVLTVPIKCKDKESYKKELKIYRTKGGIDNTKVLSKFNNDMQKKEFQKLFLLYTLGNFLCPSQSNMISPQLLKNVLSIEDPAKYNWAQFVLDHLVVAIKKFKASVSKHKCNSTRKAGGFGGCIVFLLIYYLDRLDIKKSICWDNRARIAAWDRESMKEAIKADWDEKNGFGSGKLLCLNRFQYGSAHPTEPDRPLFKDVGMQNPLPLLTPKVKLTDLRYRNRARIMIDKKLEKVKQDANDQEILEQDVVKNVCQEQVDEEEYVVCAGKEDGNVKKINKDCDNLHDVGAIKGEVDTSIIVRKKIMATMSNKDYKILQYLRSHKKTKDEDIVAMFGVNHGKPLYYITKEEINSCLQVLKHVNSPTFMFLLNIEWNKEGVVKGGKYAFDPDVSALALKGGNFIDELRNDKSVNTFIQELAILGVFIKECQHIIMPVAYDHHWFAYYFDLQRKKTYLLDSFYKLDSSYHMQVKTKLLEAMQLVLSHVNSDWSEDISYWECMQAKVPFPPPISFLSVTLYSNTRLSSIAKSASQYTIAISSSCTFLNKLWVYAFWNCFSISNVVIHRISAFMH